MHWHRVLTVRCPVSFRLQSIVPGLFVTVGKDRRLMSSVGGVTDRVSSGGPGHTTDLLERHCLTDGMREESDIGGGSKVMTCCTSF